MLEHIIVKGHSVHQSVALVIHTVMVLDIEIYLLL